jgi:hypothetical protein
VDEAGYFPLSIRESRADRERLRTVLKAVFPHPSLRDLSDDPLGIDDLVRRAPHCIVYDDRRREGFFDGRPRRVALVGDSFTFGEGVKDKDTLGYRLGRKVKHTNFLNFGLPGADIEQVRAIMRDEVVRLPDLHGVIYFFNLNDIFLEGSHPDVDIDPKSAVLYGHAGPGERSVTDRLVSASRVLTLVKTLALKRRRTRRTVQAFLDRYRREPDLDVLARHLRGMADLAAEERLAFLVVIYPLLFKDPLGSYPFGPIHRRVLGLCRSRRITCIDGYPAFAGHRSLDAFRVNAVDSHPNGRSNQRVVDHLVAKAPALLR